MQGIPLGFQLINFHRERTLLNQSHLAFKKKSPEGSEQLRTRFKGVHITAATLTAQLNVLVRSCKLVSHKVTLRKSI